jgi:hypothetical protein
MNVAILWDTGRCSTYVSHVSEETYQEYTSIYRVKISRAFNIEIAYSLHIF